MKNPFSFYEKNIFLNKKNLTNYSKAIERQDNELPFLQGAIKGQLKSILNFKKINWFFLILLLGLVILAGQIFFLQFFKGVFYQKLAEENRIRIQTISPDRGVIYDRFGKILARNIPNFSLFFIPADLPKEKKELNKLIIQVAKIVNQDPNYFKKLIDDSKSYSFEPILIQENLTYEQTILFKIASTTGFGGINLIEQTKRQYLTGPFFAHILGYLGKINPIEKEQNSEYSLTDYIGKTGLEFFYEKTLRGISGKKQIEVNSLGKEEKIIVQKPSQTGDSLILSLDLDFQEKIAQVLLNVLKKVKQSKATAVALDPKTGKILAMVSLPSFDNNLFTQGISQENYQKLINNPDKPFLNRAISGKYPPGSTIKLIMALAGLEENIINQNTIIYDKGVIGIPHQYDPKITYYFHGWQRSGLGPMNVIKAIAKSSDIFFYTIGGGYQNFKGLGVEKIVEYFKKFNLENLSGIDLPNEAKGFIPTPEWKEKNKNEQWYLGNTYHLSIGQGDLLVTPLQVALWTATIANNGIIYQPQMVDKIINSKGYLVKENFPKIIKKDFIKIKNIKIVQKGMEEAMSSGETKSLSSLPIKVAGKTGTAENFGDKNPHAWVTVYVPAENPEIVLTILVENGGWGSVTAVPAVKEILEWWIKNRHKI
ncbi:penicillin-binding protein 2 [Candidatus Kuenenbacteria bacterium HGW-Kuenenbacteria-1]|uniref:Penicillin-binding protein 2 n=1 Tax=Candidatus Kuenenbacteria bacterium HGW-Kuenenbacteria-1 TaxID=2013812 RepID=A0A2N1UNH6_9BACT|nr:MAG: penicillin-binding protein 2 [Candidatus Kuenenbacteria bacterium HGW-Kuenenbacteria-1]